MSVLPLSPYIVYGFPVPLNTCQDRRNIVRRRPSVLEDVQTQLACAVNVRVKHLTDELDAWGLVRVGFFEVHDKAKGAVLKRCVGRPYDYCVPAPESDPCISEAKVAGA